MWMCWLLWMVLGGLKGVSGDFGGMEELAEERRHNGGKGGAYLLTRARRLWRTLWVVPGRVGFEVLGICAAGEGVGMSVVWSRWSTRIQSVVDGRN